MVTVITGTSQGLGRQLVEQFGDEGLIVINRSVTGRAGEILCDLGSVASVVAAGKQLLGELGDASEVRFILNAAAYGSDIAVSDVEPAALGSLLYVNVFSQLRLVEQLVKAGLEVELIAISSGMGSTREAPEAYHFAYCASKSALNLCVRLLASQHSQLKYLLVDPGWMRTQMGGASATQDPVRVAENIHSASQVAANWNRIDGLVEVNSGKIVAW